MSSFSVGYQFNLRASYKKVSLNLFSLDETANKTLQFAAKRAKCAID